MLLVIPSYPEVRIFKFEVCVVRDRDKYRLTWDKLIKKDYLLI